MHACWFGSTSRHNFHDFEPVASAQLTLTEFRRRNRLSVVLDHNAARQEFLLQQKLLDGAW